MASIGSKIKSGIGKITNLFQSSASATPQQAATPPPAQTANQPPIQTIHTKGRDIATTSNMTPEQLKARRTARVEQAGSLLEPFHVKVFLFFLDGLCLLGPFWILVFTTSEVGQLFTGKPFDITDQTSLNVYAAALFGECVLAGLTFLWQYSAAYARNLEPGSQEKASMDKWITGMSFTWALFAAVSALGQFVYLKDHVYHGNPDAWTYLLISGRVLLYTGGDWACAKYLGWRVTSLKKLGQEEKAKGEIYAELARQEEDRKVKEAEADRRIREIEMNIKQQERSAQIATQTQEILGQAAVKFMNQFTGVMDVMMTQQLKSMNRRLELPPVEGEVKRIGEDETGDL